MSVLVVVVVRMPLIVAVCGSGTVVLFNAFFVRGLAAGVLVFFAITMILAGFVAAGGQQNCEKDQGRERSGLHVCFHLIVGIVQGCGQLRLR